MSARPGRHAKPKATYEEEAVLLGQGLSLVAGVDEVGRGCLAGPVVAGAVVLPVNPKGEWVSQIRDSKETTQRQRARLLRHLKVEARAMATGSAGPRRD